MVLVRSLRRMLKLSALKTILPLWLRVVLTSRRSLLDFLFLVYTFYIRWFLLLRLTPDVLVSFILSPGNPGAFFQLLLFKVRLGGWENWIKPKLSYLDYALNCLLVVFVLLFKFRMQHIKLLKWVTDSFMSLLLRCSNFTRRFWFCLVPIGIK